MDVKREQILKAKVSEPKTLADYDVVHPETEARQIVGLTSFIQEMLINSYGVVDYSPINMAGNHMKISKASCSSFMGKPILLLQIEVTQTISSSTTIISNLPKSTLSFVFKDTNNGIQLQYNMNGTIQALSSIGVGTYTLNL